MHYCREFYSLQDCSKVLIFDRTCEFYLLSLKRNERGNYLLIMLHNLNEVRENKEKMKEKMREFRNCSVFKCLDIYFIY